jgi:hypothetical protein
MRWLYFGFAATMAIMVALFSHHDIPPPVLEETATFDDEWIEAMKPLALVTAAVARTGTMHDPRPTPVQTMVIKPEPLPEPVAVVEVTKPKPVTHDICRGRGRHRFVRHGHSSWRCNR